MDREEIGRRSDRLLRQIGPLLGVEHGVVQGVVLTNLLAMFLANHFVEASEAETRKLREDLLSAHIEAVRRLVPVVAERFGLPPWEFG